MIHSSFILWNWHPRSSLSFCIILVSLLRINLAIYRFVLLPLSPLLLLPTVPPFHPRCPSIMHTTRKEGLCLTDLTCCNASFQFSRSTEPQGLLRTDIRSQKDARNANVSSYRHKLNITDHWLLSLQSVSSSIFRHIRARRAELKWNIGFFRE